MSMIVYPCFTGNNVGLGLPIIKKIDSIFAKNKKFPIKYVVVDPADLSSCSIVWKQLFLLFALNPIISVC